MKFHHVAVACRSEENADRFYEGILGLRKIKTSQLQKELAGQIFGMAVECQMILYGDEKIAFEVFVPDPAPERSDSFEHICLEVEERDKLLAECQAQGLNVKRILKGDSQVIFVEDYDGNLFEIKESTG